MRSFYHVLINSLIANVTISFLWFALVFWVYLETKSVLATGIIGGAYMLFVAITSIFFGTIVDHHKKKRVFVVSSAITLAFFALAGVLYMLQPASELLQIANPTFWLFIGVILLGAIVGNVRNIALSTIVTLLVPKDQRANANGLAGTVGGIGFIVTSVFSGLANGILGMGWVLVIAIAIMAVALVHVWLIAIPEEGIVHDPELAKKKVDLRGSVAAISAVPGLFALLLFSTFNNLIGGVYMALLDPYGLTLFSVEMWGILFGVAGTGFVVGGLIIAKWGLGKNPVKTLLGVVIAMGLIGALFTIREWPWLLAIGLWLYMVITPAIEAAEQTVIQRVVPYERQGRVFGFAQAFESAAAPITSFLIAPLAEFWIIPYVNSDAGQASLGWLLGAGEARGIALVFLFSGVLISVVAACAFLTKSYRRLSESYRNA